MSQPTGSLERTIQKPFTGAQIREAFLAYFEQTLASKGFAHKRVPSASLVPANNPTVLLTPAGMLPFVPVFMGLQPAPNPPRATSSQKCARVSGKASDLEAVGRTPRHHTFFEMLGNFSFGDYFKADIIPWAWAFLVDVLDLPPERLWVSVFREDDEAYAIWKNTVGVPEERIFRCDEKDNFWGPPGPTGPCGPCSEIHYDLTQNPDDPLDTRLIEIWNLVFMEFFKDEEGCLSPLEKKNVDTGMGLERIAMVVQGKANTFETDLLAPLVLAVAQHAKTTVGLDDETDVALKIVADHLRFLAFALADGVLPSNEGRGYIARMILRRAVRYGKRYLGFSKPFLHELVGEVVKGFGTAYPELLERQKNTQAVLLREEERFLETLDKGSGHLEEMLESLKTSPQKLLPGDMAFKLYDTYGFPVELTKDILQERGFELDELGYDEALQSQKALARGARKGKALISDTLFSEILSEVGASEFVGYQTLETTAKIEALIVDGERVGQVSGTNQPFLVVLNPTPFYAESGGQVGDQGSLLIEEGQDASTALVTDTQKLGELVIHHAVFDQGAPLVVGQTLTATVETNHRYGSMIHHSATHLLHAALRQVLGPEVTQAGSSVSPEGARFDFTFSRGVSGDELSQIEALINQWVRQNAAQQTDLLPLEAAKAAGAVAMFDEKYGDTVRVVSFGNASKELCGGTHIEQLGQLGLVKLVSEAAIASGVRRIELLAGIEAYRYAKQQEAQLKTLSVQLKTPVAELSGRIERLQQELKAKDKQLEALQNRLVLGFKTELLAALAHQPVVSLFLPDTHPEALKTLAEATSAQCQKACALLLGSNYEQKANVVALVSPDLVAKGVKAGDLVKQVAQACDGGGGGKPTFAQAGGKNPEPLPHALLEATQTALALLS